MSAFLLPVFLLLVSNTFMTYAWYGHLKDGMSKPLWAVVLMSWGVAFFEYCFMVPANRWGYARGISAGQLKIMQEVITLVVFFFFVKFYLGEKIPWNYYAGFGLVMAGVVVVNVDKL